MIRFIDKNTGNVFNGSKPYIHWFDGKQSLGLNYDKSFIILTDTPEVTIKTNSNIFYIVDNSKINNNIEKTYYDKIYLDLNFIKTNELYQSGITKVDDYYLYTFNIIAQGKTVGEITDSFYINDEEFLIGADFIEENEMLNINLANFGVEFSNEIQRAIYEKDINEQKTDFVLLNRKYKEILNEYINIIANKGSYKSLINSLKWFEYGDIVKIYEYWKHAEPNKNYLSKRDITQFVNEQTENILLSNTKTTFIGISIALERIKKINGYIEYENKYQINLNDYPQLLNEPNPLLENTIILWSKNEMMLKSVLLGNFFATYFLPIHLDLIHSTIENVIYTDTIKITQFPKIERFDNLDNIYPIKCKLEKTYHLTNVETFTNPDTLFGFNDRNILSENLVQLGVDTIFKQYGDTINNSLSYDLQHFKGIGVVIPFNCEMQTENSSSIITNATIKIYRKNNKNEFEIFNERNDYSVDYQAVNGLFSIKFNILIQQIGDYKIQLSFRRSDGVIYLKTFDFSVDGENYIDLKMYKLVSRYLYDELQGLPNTFNWMSDKNILEFGNIADYVLNPVQYSLHGKTEEPSTIYTQFISATKENIENTVHTNQVFIFKHDSNNTYDDFYNNIQFKINGVKKYFSDVVNDFIKIEMDRFGNSIQENENNDDVLVTIGENPKITYTVLINKYPIIKNDLKYPYYESCETSLKYWCREMFIPYFYKLEEIGSVSEVNKIIDNLSETEIFKIRNNENSYTISNTDVICFLPSLRCVRRPKDFMWKYKCCSDNSEIMPITYRTSDMNKVEDYKNETHMDKSNFRFPTILQPLFGRYDFRLLPQKGFYDITFSYKLDDDENNQVKNISSLFLQKF